MQDRYLFKAKRIKGQWVEGAFYIEPYTDRCYIIQWNSTGLGFNEFIEVDGETVCQCTGLKDKNGNLIWENDIVKINNSEVNTLITFRDFEIICTIPREKYYKHRLEHTTEYEVVGNVFDNPELLEE